MSEPAPVGPTRHAFGPVVLLGLAAGALAAFAGTRVWVRPRLRGADADWALTFVGPGGQVPLATTLALVVLAGWGALLVTRSRTRALAGWLTLVAAASLLAVTVWGGWSVTGSLASEMEQAGFDRATVELTGWFWAALVGAAGCLATTMVAARLLTHWPEMSARYDAPATGQRAPAAAGDGSPVDLWKAMDEGRDPTAGP